MITGMSRIKQVAIKSSFPVMHKFDNVRIFVFLETVTIIWI